MATSFGNTSKAYVRNFFPTFLAFKRQHPSAIKSHRRCLSTAVTAIKDRKDVTEYPEVKPKFPPGEWGNMDRKYAWMWSTFRDKLMSLPSVQERIDVFLQKETDAVLLQQINDHPASLQFREYVTKTVARSWNEEETKGLYTLDSDLIDKMLKDLKDSLADQILLEQESVHREGIKPELTQSKMCRSIIQCISQTLIGQYAKDFKHLQECQLDEDVVAQALWDCQGLARDTWDGKVSYSSLEDILTIVEELDERVHAEVIFDMVLRGYQPLPAVEPRNGGLSVTGEAPKLLYKPNSYGHKHHKKRKLKGIFAGHKAGDPCEFGLLGFLNTCPTLEIEQSMSLKVAQDYRLALGITGAFTWLAAQAYNQGFSPAIDLTYPLTSQIVLTDGQRFSFLLYQLNTLSLWRESNEVKNLCWHTKEMPLYHSIENGQVREFNDDVLKMLIQMFLLAPRDRGFDLKPTVTEKDPNIHLKSDFIPEKIVVEEIVEEEKYIV